MDFEKPKIESKITSNKDGILTVRFSPDQKIICSGGNGKKAILTDYQDFRTVKTFDGHSGPIFGSDFSANGILLATGSGDKTAKIWNVEGEENKSIVESSQCTFEGHTQSIWCIRFCRKNDPGKVITGSEDRSIKVWDCVKEEEISTLNGSGWVFDVDILPDNNTLLSGNFEGKLNIWDCRKGKVVKNLDHHRDPVYSVQFHPESNSIASGCFGKYVSIFDMRTYKLLQKYEEHTDVVLPICFHPSGKYIISGSQDKTMKVYDILEKRVIYTLTDHESSVNAVQFSPDGNFFASGSSDKNVFFWNFPLGRKFHSVKDIDEDERRNHMIQNYLLLYSDVDEEFDVFCERRKVLEIKIDHKSSLLCLKILLL